MANTIKLKKYSDVVEEFTAGGAITPGHLVMVNSSGDVVVHNSAGGNAFPMFALENELEGGDMDTAYANDDQVQVWIPGRGDIVNAILKDGQNVVIGDWLESAGDGTLQKHAADSSGSAIYGNQLVGQVVAAVDLSGSSGTHPSTGLRVQVRIV